ncbi:MAG: type II toxin-antitoxin system RelE/ParE family toxin [Candidatus Thiodiazotropha endolucinida]
MKRYRVRLTENAEQDLIDIYRYIALHDSEKNVDYVLDQLESLCSRLAELPKRGHIPPELDRIGMTNDWKSTSSRIL